MRHSQVCGLQPVDHSERIAIEAYRQNRRFAGVPYYREAVPDPARGKDLREEVDEGLLSDDRLRVSMRKITVPAINVAERGRLDDQQLHPGHEAAPDP
jgi:hypothetical protein